MRTPKRLYAEERIIYRPELLPCLHCGDLLVTWNYLAWDKTVQTLDRLLSIATRPGRCPHATCPGSRMRLLSAEAQRVAPEAPRMAMMCSCTLAGGGSTSARPIARFTPIFPPGAPSPQPMCAIFISTSIYLCWPATSVSSAGALAEVAQEQGGVIIALDGLA